jgi:predicted dehydrogenase/threonine dehydrogenase-like Zn-dependent dehydrogenase
VKQVLISRGSVIVEDVPVPGIGPGEVLVQVRSSCLSIGTEMSGLRSSAVPLWHRALRHPEKVAATVRMAVTKGLKRTWNLIEQKQGERRQTGYSAAGVIIEVGSDIKDLALGDRVACAGGGYAVHAEFIRVPRNLCVPLDDSIDWDSASTVTLGAIALQGVRRAQPTLGETFVVIGLGILGQLTLQLLRANGCRTIGIDIDSDRLELAAKLGMNVGLDAGNGDLDQVARLTDGLGADGAIITAATPSDTVVSQAFKVCRKKGRVVLVGDVGLNLNRDDFYIKEIDFHISTSYGPGRYDHRYEEQGLDYPAAYVRWTENRNMAEYLRLVAEENVKLEPLISARFPITDAAKAYETLNVGTAKPLMVLLTYPDNNVEPIRTLTIGKSVGATPGKIRVAIIGAGAFAQSIHLPNLHSLNDRFTIHSVVSRSGHKASAAAKRFGAVNASTDFGEVLADSEVNAVIIATRHHLHAEMALRALKAGKHVLVEKPLALQASELEALDDFISAQDRQSAPVLLTGYNRRFSVYATRMAQLLEHRSGPFLLDYRMNAGYIPMDHWVHGPEGGGRNLGEACHIYDLFTFLANAEAIQVSALGIAPRSAHYARNDNFIATLRFADGSVASLTYAALGSTNYAKETADLHVDGKTAVMHDYTKLDVYGDGTKPLRSASPEKGFKSELIAFADGVNNGRWPIPWWQQRQVATLALEIENLLSSP